MKRTVIANGLSQTALMTLKKQGIDVVTTKNNSSVDDKISFHADLSFFYDGYDTLFIASEMKEYKDFFSNYVPHVIVIPEKYGKKYPNDVLLNCVTIGRNLICNIDTVSETVLNCLKEKGFAVINVKQGYTKCSVLPVSDSAIITDDPSIADLCCLAGIDVLLVSKGSVRLDGFDYGFIGGASGRISADMIAFCGDLTSHSDSSEIIEFLDKYGLKYLSLDTNQLYDIGSIIPLYGG